MHRKENIAVTQYNNNSYYYNCTCTVIDGIEMNFEVKERTIKLDFRILLQCTHKSRGYSFFSLGSSRREYYLISRDDIF